MGSNSAMGRRTNRGLGGFILDTLAHLFGFATEKVVSGKIDLSHGKQELVIKLNGNPWAVWTSFKNTANIPCCVGDVDMLGVEIIPNGFILYADIKSVSRHVRWFANIMQ